MTVVETREASKSVYEFEYLDSFKPRLMDWGAARIFAMKNLRIALRYPANMLVWGVLPMLWFAPYILMYYALAGGDASIAFTEISGFNDYVSFAVIGWFVWMWLDNSIWAIGNNFRWEQFSGTLEPLFLTPVPRISILIGSAVSDTIQAAFQSVILLTFASLLFGLEYSIIAIAPTIIIILVMIVALYGFSFALAGLIMVFKDPSVLSNLISELSYMVSPISYPLQALPSSVRYVSYLIPTTIALVTIRQIAISGLFDALEFVWALLGIGGLAIMMWAIGLVCFRFAERWTRERGHMGGF